MSSEFEDYSSDVIVVSLELRRKDFQVLYHCHLLGSWSLQANWKSASDYLVTLPQPLPSKVTKKAEQTKRARSKFKSSALLCKVVMLLDRPTCLAVAFVMNMRHSLESDSAS